MSEGNNSQEDANRYERYSAEMLGKNKIDLYKVLGLPSSASNEDIRKSYRKRALTTHTNKGGNINKFNELQEAYNILNNKDLKKIYDTAFSEGHVAIPSAPSHYQPTGSTVFNPEALERNAAALRQEFSNKEGARIQQEALVREQESEQEILRWQEAARKRGFIKWRDAMWAEVARKEAEAAAAQEQARKEAEGQARARAFWASQDLSMAGTFEAVRRAEELGIAPLSNQEICNIHQDKWKREVAIPDGNTFTREVTGFLQAAAAHSLALINLDSQRQAELNRLKGIVHKNRNKEIIEAHRGTRGKTGRRISVSGKEAEAARIAALAALARNQSSQTLSRKEQLIRGATLGYTVLRDRSSAAALAIRNGFIAARPYFEQAAHSTYRIPDRIISLLSDVILQNPKWAGVIISSIIIPAQETLGAAIIPNTFFRIPIGFILGSVIHIKTVTTDDMLQYTAGHILVLFLLKLLVIVLNTSGLSFKGGNPNTTRRKKKTRGGNITRSKNNKLIEMPTIPQSYDINEFVEKVKTFILSKEISHKDPSMKFIFDIYLEFAIRVLAEFYFSIKNTHERALFLEELFQKINSSISTRSSKGINKMAGLFFNGELGENPFKPANISIRH